MSIWQIFIMQLNGSKQFVNSDVPFKMTIVSTDGTSLTGSTIYFYLHKNKNEAPILTLDSNGNGLTITSSSTTKIELQGNIDKSLFNSVTAKQNYHYITKIILSSGHHRILNSYTGSFSVELP